MQAFIWFVVGFTLGVIVMAFATWWRVRPLLDRLLKRRQELWSRRPRL